MKRPERELQVANLEAPTQKLDRIVEEWRDIWGITPVRTIQLEEINQDCNPPVEAKVPPTRRTSKGVELPYRTEPRSHEALSCVGAPLPPTRRLDSHELTPRVLLAH